LLHIMVVSVNVQGQVFSRDPQPKQRSLEKRNFRRQLMNQPDWIGQTLGGRYQIQELIGQGGMSSVFKAFDPNLQRVVAVKLIHSHLSGDPRFTARFEDEARAVAKLRHSNIVQVYDFNHDGAVYYMVQEFVPGQTLQSLQAQLNEAGERLPLAVAIKYTINVCHAIDYAHRLGMIHRDIKPANIIINEDDQAILMDFGIVKLLQGDSHTTTGTILGTLSYMSPDLIRGEPPDARSDIYSLGVTLFEMLSGQVPFQSDSAITLMMMHQNEPVPDLHLLRQDTPEDLIAIVQKSLAKTRPERYTTAGEMGDALSAVYARLTQSDVKRTVQLEAPLPASTLEAPSDGRSQPTFAQEHPASAMPATVPSSTMPTAVVASTPQTPPAAAPAAKKSRFPAWIGIAVIVLIVLIIAGGFGLSKMFAAKPASVGLTAQDMAPTQVVNTPLSVAVTAPATASIASAMLTPLPSNTPLRTALPPASSTPVSAALPGLPGATSLPADIPYAQISKIDIDSQDRYVVSFDILNPDKFGSSDSVVFFFNSVPRTLSGFPKQDFYTIYSSPSPFTILKAAARPKEAYQMCALVGKYDHSLVADSGNCFPLPDVASVTATPY
jgi:serine/threonine protein kinase